MKESREAAPSGEVRGTDHSTTDTHVPLLNEYKHALLRRRLLQTITGGVKIRRAPWYIHLIQLSLWIIPLVIALPLTIISALRLWNEYYLALIYGTMQGLSVLLLEMIGVIIRYRHPRMVNNGDTQLDDEESIDFTLGSCCTFETYDFIFTHKKLHSLLIHPLISGLVSFSASFILQPSIMLESLHIAGVVIVSVIGWYTLCSAHYSLSVLPPHETATYRPTDPLDFRFITRSFYIVAIAAIFIPLRFLVSMPTVTLYLQLLYASLCLLPLGWLVGFLPPLDALIPWIMEQGLTRLMGGSPMATDLRLAVMFFISSISVAIVASLTTLNGTLSVLLATAFGFLLSQDIFTCFKSPIYLLSLLSKAKFLHSVHSQLTNKTFTSFYGWDCQTMSNLKTLAVHYLVSMIKGAALLAVSLVIVYFTFLSSGDAEVIGTQVTAGVVIGLFCLLQGSNMLQKIYLFRLLRNPLFPNQAENVTKFYKRRKLLHYASIPVRLIDTYVSPLVMLTFIGFSLKTPNTSASIPRAWCGVVAARILRKVWQNTSSAHFEVAIVAILHFAIPTNNIWTTLGAGSQLLIIGVTIEILQDFLQKSSFAGTMFGNFIFIRKHRTYLSLTVVIITATFIFLPVLLAIILISSIFSSPLLPLFTLPVFLVSFPRAKRFWPSLINYASSYSKCQDSIYYRQSESEIAKVLHHAVSSGAISATPGMYLLLRFEDRLCVVTFLEHSYGHCMLAIKGLELQETSCHSIEATRIDSIFEDAYNPSLESCPNSKFWFNTHVSNTLQPVDSEVIEVYSDARNVLTGIIDQPSSLSRFSDNLMKCLVWIFYLHFTQAAANEQQSESEKPHNLMNGIPAQLTNNFDAGKAKDGQNNDSNNAWTLKTDKNRTLEHVKPESTNREADTFSWSESISSIDDVNSTQTDGLTAATTVFSLDAVDSLPGLIPQDRPLDKPRHAATTNIDDINGNNDFIPSEVRLSAIPISEMSRLQQVGDLEVAPEIIEIPRRWMEGIPLSHLQLSELRAKFPTDWLEFLIKRDHGKGLTDFLRGKLVDLIIVCLTLTDVGTSSCVSGRRTEETKPFDIFEGFCGRFPYSTHSDWLNGDQLLSELLLKAYRYAVRLMYDEVSLGEVDDFTELVEYLESYSSDYFIGLESEKGWEEAVTMQIPHLFSLGRDPEKNVYTAHVLSLQPHIVHIGQLNPAAIHGIWSDLSLELLYLTNDDEERYSIQAHPTLMRNLTIQTSDPPLGYYIYSSGILRVPCT